MDKDKRQLAIIQKIQHSDFIKIRELSLEMEVSMETIRRDLSELELHYHLDRIHGGVRIRQTNIEEKNFIQRRVSFANEKKELARHAISLVSENSFLALDASTTNLAIAKELILHFKQLAIITNCLSIAQELVLNSDFKVLVPPGEITKELVISGSAAVTYISAYYTDLFFMSTSGITMEDGIMDYGFQEYDVKKAMLTNSHAIYAVADYHKFGQHSKIKICPFDKISGIVTDSTISLEYIDYFKAKDIPIFY